MVTNLVHGSVAKLANQVWIPSVVGLREDLLNLSLEKAIRPLRPTIRQLDNHSPGRLRITARYLPRHQVVLPHNQLP